MRAKCETCYEQESLKKAVLERVADAHHRWALLKEMTICVNSRMGARALSAQRRLERFI